MSGVRIPLGLTKVAKTMSTFYEDESTLRVKGIWAEDIFRFAYTSILRCGGDGGAAIICGNPHETFLYFKDWYKHEYKKDLPESWIKLESDHQVDLSVSQDNLIFTNNKELRLWPGECVFIVEGRCQFGFIHPGYKSILPVE